MWARFDEEGCPAWFGPEPIPGAEKLEFGGIWEPGLLENFLTTHRRNADGDWEPRPPVVPQQPTPEEIAARAAAEVAALQEAEEAARKMVGVAFEGIMCSATANDQNGLVAVAMAIQVQGMTFLPTMFKFENGSRLRLTKDNYDSFRNTWLPFRQSFFLAE